MLDGDEQNAEEVTTIVEPNSQTDTAEADFLALLKEAREEEQRKADEKYKGIQRVISAREMENKELKKQLEEKPVVGGLNKRIIDLMESGDFDQARQLIATQEQEQSKQVTLQRQQAITEGHRQRIREEIIAAGQNPNSAIFEDVFEKIDFADAVDGKFDRADRKLAAVLSSIPKKPEVTDADVEERARQLLEKKGLLKAETGSPSASNQGYDKLRDAYIANPNNKKAMDEYLKARQERGL